MLAYPAAAAVGAALVAAGFTVMGIVAQVMNGVTERVFEGLWIIPAAFLYAFVVFLIGLAVIGTPAWLVLVRTGRTTRQHAMLAGAGLCFLAGAIVVAALGEPVLAWEPWALIASLAVPGAAAGWTLHRVAYGQPGDRRRL